MLTIEQAIDIFEDNKDLYLETEGLTEVLSKRPDLNAFMILDRLVPSNRDIVGDAQHDEIMLDISLEQLILAATEEDIKNLVRCGVRLIDNSWLGMFV